MFIMYQGYTNGLVQDCGSCSVLAMELLQPYTNPLIGLFVYSLTLM